MSLSAEWKRKIGVGLILLGVVLVGLWAFNVYRAATSLLDYINEGQALVEGNPLESDPEELGDLLAGVRAEVVRLKRSAGWLARVGPAFGWLPRVGPLWAQSAELLELADALTEAGELAWDDAAPVLAALQSEEGAPMTVALAEAAEGVQPDLPALGASVERAQAAYAGLDVAALPYRFRAPLEQLGAVLPLLDEGVGLAMAAPDLLGIEAPRTYLVLALNEDELRAGGGFITGVGEVRVAGGEVARMTFSDSYAADDFSQPYPDPPEPLRDFMGLDLWVFRDSNWSPDFPTAARQAMALYRPGYPVEVDGVVALDQIAVRRLVGALGPLEVEGVEVTGGTLLDYLRRSWAPEDGELDRAWWEQRKSFMGPLAEAAWSRLQAGDVDARALAETGLRLLEEKHVQLYLEEPQAAALLAVRGWDGGLPERAGDYLMVVESNVGYNKASASLARAFSYRVDLGAAPPRATATLTYTHTAPPGTPCKPEIRYDPVYEQMMERCYWGHLRLYVPEGAEVVEASRHPIPAASLKGGVRWPGRVQRSEAPEGPWTVFEQAFLLPPAEEEVLRFTYEVPADVVQAKDEDTFVYRLDWPKQAGLERVPLRIVLHLPRNGVLLSSQPRPAASNGGVLLYEIDRLENERLEVVYQVPEEDLP